jgi:hypothetical protein
MLAKKDRRYVAFRCGDGMGGTDLEGLVFTVEVGKVAK